MYNRSSDSLDELVDKLETIGNVLKVGGILVGILWFVLLYFIAKRFYTIACEKGYTSRAYFHYCFWLGLVGWIMVTALPDRRSNPPKGATPPIRPTPPRPAPPRPTPQSNPNSEYVICPKCGERESNRNSYCFRCGAPLKQLADAPRGEANPISDTPQQSGIKPIFVGEGTIKCPKCDTAQRNDRHVCMNCGARFQY